MTESTVTAIVLTIVAQTVVVTGVIIRAHIGGLERHASISERVRVLEVIFEKFGRGAAKALHIPHDPYGIDPLLDKYLDRNYELSNEEWRELMDRCYAIEERHGETKEHIFFASMLGAICAHKLMLPPPTRKHKEAIA